MSKINSFIDYASDILGDTENGISTSQIISICNRFATEYNVNIPHTRIYQGFNQTFSNKRTVLKVFIKIIIRYTFFSLLTILKLVYKFICTKKTKSIPKRQKLFSILGRSAANIFLKCLAEF